MPPATAPGPLLPATLAQARRQMEEPQGNRPRRPRLNLAKNRPQAGNPLYLLSACDKTLIRPEWGPRQTSIWVDMAANQG